MTSSSGDSTTSRRCDGSGVACGLEDAGREDEDILVAWGAWRDGGMVGAIALERLQGLDTVNWMAVDAAWRRRGVAGRLYAALEYEAHQRGVRRLWVTARAPAFFLRHGFEPAPEGPEAAILLNGCVDCDQYGNGCEPRALTRRLDRMGSTESS